MGARSVYHPRQAGTEDTVFRLLFNSSYAVLTPPQLTVHTSSHTSPAVFSHLIHQVLHDLWSDAPPEALNVQHHPAAAAASHNISRSVATQQCILTIEPHK